MEPNGGTQVQPPVQPVVQPQPPVVTQQPQASTPPPPSTTSGLLQWRASEYIDHQKNMGWFVPLIAGAVILCVLMYVFTRSIMSSAVVLMGAVAFGMFATQRPQTLTYTLTETGIQAGAKLYQYDDFRSFSIVQDGALYSILLQPMRRFMPPLSIYFAAQDGEQIFDILAGRLPHEEKTLDPIERAMRKIRF